MGTLSLLHNLNVFFLSPQNPILSHHSSPSPSPSPPLSLKPLTFHCSKSSHIPALSPSTPLRIPRTIRIEARRALMDYLHFTRNYTFIHAEFVTNNSPHFINSLISKINLNKNGDVFRSIRKYLRYNPINEFEPFLESLGINQSELQSILPSRTVFLSDDTLLSDNFRCLYNHGVPRNRIGKIYTQAREVFRFENGVLAKKFQDYQGLGLSKSTVIKLFVCCPLLLVGDDVDSVFVAVLDWLNRIGIESEWIAHCMSCSKNYSWKTMLDSIEFLHQVGYSEKQMYTLFKEDPKLLLDGFGKKMYLLLARLIKSGVEVNVISSCFIEHPSILSSKCVENVMNVISFLYNIRMEQDDIACVLSKYMHVLSKHSIKGHKTVCKELGIGKAELCQIIKDDPLEFIRLASKPEQKGTRRDYNEDPRRYLEKTTFLLKLGYLENSEEMEEAVKVFKGRGDELQERFDCLVEAGLDYNRVVEMIKRAPMILNLKRTLIQKKIDFLINVLGYPIECLLGYPTYFCHDLDKITARFSMYEWLKTRNAINPELNLSSIVSSNEKRFVKYFVNVHPEGPAIWQSITSLSNKDKK